MKKETWKTIIQLIVSILTAALTALAPAWAFGVFRAMTECHCGPTKGSKSPLATEGKDLSLFERSEKLKMKN